MMPLIYQSPVFFLFEKGKPNILAFFSLGKNTVRMAQVHFWLSDQNANRDRGPILRQTT